MKRKLFLAVCLFLAFAELIECQCGPDGSKPYPPGSTECPAGPSGPSVPTLEEQGNLCDGNGGSTRYVESVAGETRTISTNGCPNHYSLCTGKDGVSGCGSIGNAGSSTEARDTEKEKTVLANPVIAQATTDLTCALGAIGYALNGVSIYSGAVDNQCGLLDVEDDTAEWTSFDWCSGHAEKTGDYHYHFPPSCLLAQLGTMGSGHSPQVGWAFDGFPVYGPKGPGGIDMKPCGSDGADSQFCLDECGGLYNADDGGVLSQVDEFKYRYYFTGPTSDLITLPSTPQPANADYPFTFACYKGCLYEDYISGECTQTESGVTAKYVATANQGVTEAFSGEAPSPSPPPPPPLQSPPLPPQMSPPPSNTDTKLSPPPPPLESSPPSNTDPTTSPPPPPLESPPPPSLDNLPPLPLQSPPPPDSDPDESGSPPPPVQSPPPPIAPNAIPSPPPPKGDSDNQSPPVLPDDSDTIVQITAKFKFEDMDVAEVNDAVKNSVKIAVANEAGVPVELVEVTGVQSGSAIIETVIIFPSEAGATDFQAVLESNAVSIFSDNEDLADKGFNPEVVFDSKVTTYADAKEEIERTKSPASPEGDSAGVAFHTPSCLVVIMALVLLLLTL